MRPIFWDTETTGLRPERDRIVEIAAFDPVREKTFVQLLQPEMAIPSEASSIHGITDEMVREAPLFREILPAWQEFCEGEVILVAHNGDSFDMRFLRAEFTRAGASMPAYRTIDTLKWSRRYRPDLPKHQLQFLREVYGLPANQAHRALDDVITLSRVFSAMIDDLPWEVVCELATRSG
jgi:DNA polymerase-3 subunit epsilon